MKPKIAIVSDALVQRGGAERVVEVLAETFPEAPIFATLYSPSRGPASIRDRVVPSYLNRIPGATARHRWLFPLYPSAIESFDLSAFDVIVSSHHTVGKNLLRSAAQYHLCYCHTPMRLLWEREVEKGRIAPFARPVVDAITRDMRVWDLAGAARVDDFVANSSTTQRRIATHYRRDAAIVAPPIDTERFHVNGCVREDFYLVASRLIPYKRIDLAVSATARLGRRLVIVGAGPEAARLTGANVENRGHVSDRELVELMQRARGMIFPAFDDFGMSPVEMMACGGAVVALGRGGALETVIPGVTGVLADAQTTDAFAHALTRFEATAFSSERIRAHAETFSRAVFTEKMRALVGEGFARLSRS